MIIETQYFSHSKKLMVSFINTEGDAQTEYFDWEFPFKYVRCADDDPDRDTEFRAWEGDSIKKVYGGRPDRYSIYEFLDSLEMDEELKNQMFGFNLPKTYFIDIETEIIDGFPDPAIAPTMIQSISIVFDDKILLYGLKTLTSDAIKRIEDRCNDYFKDFGRNYKVKYVKFEDEFNMLYQFFTYTLKKMPCITGWNFLDFDFQFLVNRARKLTKYSNGKEWTIDVRKSSLSNKMNEIWKTEYVVPAHKLVFDYMLLYECLDTTVKVKESSSLDFVSKALIGVGKVEFDGSFTKLYEEDFETFMFYNATDSILVQQIHERGGYLNIVFAIASLAKIQAMDVYSHINKALGSLAITEGVLRHKFREDEKIVFFGESSDERKARYDRQKVYYDEEYIKEQIEKYPKKEPITTVDISNTIQGGWVKDPMVGMNNWVACYDFASLYPTTQRQYHIAPENFIGISTIKEKEYYKTPYGKKVKVDHNNDVIIKVENNAVDINDPGRFIYTAFKKRNSPTLKMLDEVYKDRKVERKKMMDKRLELADLESELERLKQEL